MVVVDQALRSFGVRIDDAELRHIARGWDLTRAMVDGLYAVPDARYVDPAPRFRADPAPEAADG